MHVTGNIKSEWDSSLLKEFTANVEYYYVYYIYLYTCTDPQCMCTLMNSTFMGLLFTRAPKQVTYCNEIHADAHVQ